MLGAINFGRASCGFILGCNFVSGGEALEGYQRVHEKYTIDEFLAMKSTWSTNFSSEVCETRSIAHKESEYCNEPSEGRRLKIMPRSATCAVREGKWQQGFGMSRWIFLDFSSPTSHTYKWSYTRYNTELSIMSSPKLPSAQ